MHNWNTRFRDDGSTHKDYVVIRHPIPNFKNTNVFGIKFTGGFAVVKRNSKDYHKIKKIPVFKKAREFPLEFLKKAGFRGQDIQMVFGRTIFVHYMAALGFNPQGKPLPVEAEKVEKTEKKFEPTRSKDKFSGVDMSYQPDKEDDKIAAEEPAETPVENIEATEIAQETVETEVAEIVAEEPVIEAAPVEAKPKKKRRRRKKKSLEVMVNNEETALEE
jgi:hypothetical protein